MKNTMTMPADFDITTLELLNEEEKNFISNACCYLSNIVSYLTSQGGKPDEFKFNSSSLDYIQEYLDLQIKPNVVKWCDRNYSPVRVKTNKGLKTSKPSEVAKYDNLLKLIGVLYGQCLAQELGLKWKYQVDGGLSIGTNAEYSVDDILPFNKPRKVCSLPKEESLDSIIHMHKSKEMHDMIIMKVIERMEKEGEYVPAPNNRLFTTWLNPTGQLEAIQVKESGTGKVLKTVRVAEMFAGETPEQCLDRTMAQQH